MRLIKSIIKRYNKYYKKKHTYDYSSTSETMTKIKGPVIGGNNKDVYFDPYVYYYDGEYLMYVSNRTQNCISLFKSNDGLTWGPEIAVLKGKNDNISWDSRINRACIVKNNNKFFMYYTGQNNEKSKIGLAISSDGINFERFQNKAILIPERKYEKQNIMNPCVIWDKSENVYKMWYCAGEHIEPDVICYAVSQDGINWNKYFNNPVLTHGNNEYDKVKVGGCDVHKVKNYYIMFYIGYQHIDIGRICVAFSKDGILWDRYDKNPILSPSRNQWDCNAVYKPSAILDNENILIWYNGRNDFTEAIGFARGKL